MTGAVAAPAPIRRRPLGLLAAGHFCTDLCQGAIPAMLPFLMQERGLSYATAFGLILAQTVSSSVVQPVFGRLSDRRPMPWLMPVGLVLAGLALGTATQMPTYPLTWAAVAVSGLGIAAFHPEAARYANRASGSRRATGMSIFAVGGNLGFAAGPLITTPLLLTLGLPDGWLLAIPAVAAGLVLLAGRPWRVGVPVVAHGASATAARDRWGAFARLSGALICRSVIFFGLNATIPLFLERSLGESKAVGGEVLTLFLLFGALGALVAGRLADRFSRRAVVIAGFVAAVPLSLILALAGSPLLATVIVAPLAVSIFMPSSVMVVLGQEYLPNQIGTASGMTLGLAVSIGGIAEPGLGALGDRWGLHATLLVLAVLAVVAVRFSITLPRESREVLR